MVNRRICIFPQDIRVITGRGEKAARQLYRKIKAFYHKKDHQFLTFKEFCEYAGIPPEELNRK